MDNKTESINLAAIFTEFKENDKNMDRTTMVNVLESVFRDQLEKMYPGSDIDIILNIDKGDFEIWRKRMVVETVEDPAKEISLEEVHKVDDSFEACEEYSEQIHLNSFGHRAILSLKQNLTNRITEIRRTSLYNKYKDMIGTIFGGEVYQVWKREVLVRDEEMNDLVLPKDKQIPSDYYHKGDTIKAVIESVDMNGNNPVITLSRTSTKFLERLFEQEVPEIFDGLITIKKVVRVPGVRAKVAVESYDDRIDPVGACVGVKGSRIHGIVHELRNENIDVINWTSNTELLVQRALAPAKVSSVKIDEDTKHILVFLKPSEVSLAIGKSGANIRLAGELVGYTVDVYREAEDASQEEDDVLLTEFEDEIEPWIIESLQKMGCDTAKSVLAISDDDIMERADLERETVEEVKKILKAEFAEE